jgi:hypothetical protein
MASGDKNSQDTVYNTTNSLMIFEPRNIIANFKDVYNYTTNRPVTNFSYLKVSDPKVQSTDDLNLFYGTRTPSNFIPTEGTCNYKSPTGNLPFITTTSILNTPYFINAIQSGVDSWRRSEKYPYVKAAYLFLNSLPLATLREKYQTEGGQKEGLDYIASCFKKFGAIHKIPYAWMLKYGSIWHRYKKYNETKVDILSDIWTNFDYTKNYSPISGTTTQTYTLDLKDPSVPPHKITLITLQTENDKIVSIQPGFYPKVINDFNVFLNGYDLYVNYTDNEIQKSIDSGLKVFNFSDSNIKGNQNTKILNLTTWSVLLPDTIDSFVPNTVNCSIKNNTNTKSYFVIPSFGASINQTKNECLNGTSTKVDLTNNSQMYNGSIRSLWASPNYGYFDSVNNTIPAPNSYMNLIDPLSIYSDSLGQTPFKLIATETYSKIEEVFSVFEKKILDQFEQQFLNFCKPITDIDMGIQSALIGTSTVDIDGNFKNFQSLYKTLVTVNAPSANVSNTEYFQSTIGSQLSVFSNGIKNFMEYDVIFRYGNPTNYKRRIFGSFLSDVVDPIKFTTYVPNTLPSNGGGITLSQSVAKYPKEWSTLETEVGFSTIPNLVYSDNGSYITDFFIENNIEFSVQNIVLCAPLVKMFATQKLNVPTLTSSQFKSQLSNYLTGANDLQNFILNETLTGIQKALPEQSQLPENVIKSAISGEQGKVESYEVFKAINDKWIAGGDFKSKTLFEDMMFLDRASRNIGDTILIDIFDLKNILNKESLNSQQTMSVFTFISGLLIKNNFTVMNLPGYVNFYNIQEVDGITTPQPEGSLDFANNMWGTFLNVDYRNSSPKMVCFYVGKPSQYLDLPKGNFRYRDDAFEMRRASDNPLIENLQGKKDWAVSNRCVGFNVDIGNRNQNIFYSFNVSQDSGKATSETISTLLNMVDNASGRNVATQNVSLYNLYKQRSYQCSVVSLGNALLQPTMYFNLRHVPMFNGPYMITDVHHTISPGVFQTTFTGVRQGIFDLPSIDNFLQSINQNLLTKLEALLKIKNDDVNVPPTTNQGKSADTVQKADGTKDTTNSCTNSVNLTAYPAYIVTGATLTTMTPDVFASALIRKIPNNPYLQSMIYVFSYVRTFVSSSGSGAGTFNGWNNNFASISLSDDFNPTVQYFQKTYCCVTVKSKSQPLANFANLDDYIDFMSARLSNSVDRIINPNMGLEKYYVCYFPKTNVSEEYYEANKKDYEVLLSNIKKGLKSSIGAKLQDYDKAITQSTIPDNKPGVTPTPTRANICLPVISSFSPLSGKTGTIVQLNGIHLDNVVEVIFGNNFADPKLFNRINSETLRVSVPNQVINNTSNQVNVVIHNRLDLTISTAKAKFTYI